MTLDKRDLYRLPWSLNDNPIGWLEVTDVCNLRCRGCYRQRLDGHKPLDQVREEVLFLKRWRNCDSISIAGGEPLLHPEICAIVDLVHRAGMKPFILSNGLRLSRELLRDLKRSHLMSIGFHVDSLQGRPGSAGKSELDLNETRLRLAELVAEVGGLPPAGFGITTYRQNLRYVPDLIRWHLQHRRIVGGATLITYRSASADGTYRVGDAEIAVSQETLGYISQDAPSEFDITAPEVYALIRRHFPQYDVCAYLNGNQRHDSYKWLVGSLVCSGSEVLGHYGRKTAEIAQVGHHLLFGTYFVYLRGRELGKRALLLGLVDPEMRQVAGWYLRNPFRLLFEPVIGIAIGIIQAPDVLPDGRVDHCDGCPDMTYWDGKLVHSCRLDEYRKFGQLVTPGPAEDR